MNISLVPARRVSDPGAPELRADVTAVVALAVLIAVVVAAAGGGRDADLAVLGAALVVGELLPVRLTDGSALPLSLALLMPLALAADPVRIGLVAGGAVALAAPAHRRRSLPGHAIAVAERIASGLAAWAAHRAALSMAAPGRAESVLIALVAASLAVLATELAIRHLRGAESFMAAGGLAAFFAVAASGILIAVAYAGVDGRRAMGLWGLPVFVVPALSARWAFGRLHAIRRTYDQTIHVLSVVPEMGGRVRPGHSRRVADLALDIAGMLGLSRRASLDLERAALLHALGSVTLEEAHPPGPREVAGATVDVLRDERGLSGPAGLVAGMAGERVGLRGDDLLAADVLAVASAYENITGGDSARARAALEVITSPPPGGDRRVLAALARVVTRRTLSRARA